MRRKSFLPSFWNSPTSQSGYLALIAWIPCQVLLNLWYQGLLNLATFTLTIFLSGCFCAAVPYLQRPSVLRWIEREFHRYDSKIVSALGSSFLSADERSELLRQREVLWERYHLITKLDDTHRKVREVGRLLFFVAKVARMVGGLSRSLKG